MIWINFGSWQYRTRCNFILRRLYTRKRKWTPFVRRHRIRTLEKLPSAMGLVQETLTCPHCGCAGWIPAAGYSEARCELIACRCKKVLMYYKAKNKAAQLF
jgi:hypothetical protein